MIGKTVLLPFQQSQIKVTAKVNYHSNRLAFISLKVLVRDFGNDEYTSRFMPIPSISENIKTSGISLQMIRYLLNLFTTF